MPIEVLVPRIGWSMEEGTFVEWIAKHGDFVRAGEILFVLESEKASQEIETCDSGTLHIPIDAPRPGDTVVVGQRLAYLLAEGESPPPPTSATSALPIRRTSSPIVGPKRVAGPAARRLARELGVDLDAVPTPDPTGRVISEDIRRLASSRHAEVAVPSRGARTVASPRARRKAGELGVDWKRIVGSGRKGRVCERDVLAAARQLAQVSFGLTQPSVPPSVSGTMQPCSRIRRTIAQRVLAAIQQTAPVTLTTKVDALALFQLRHEFKAQQLNSMPSYGDILVRLVASTLPNCPELNACWVNDSLYLYDEINIAIAIDTPRGLVAPVLRNASNLSLAQITAESQRLVERARQDELTENQLAGATFTVTNLGMFDVDFFTPIINLPQAAILGVGRVAEEPVIMDGRVVPGKTLSLSLTFDHRVLDGAPAARWLQQLAKIIQQPDLLLGHTR